MNTEKNDLETLALPAEDSQNAESVFLANSPERVISPRESAAEASGEAPLGAKKADDEGGKGDGPELARVREELSSGTAASYAGASEAKSSFRNPDSRSEPPSRWKRVKSFFSGIFSSKKPEARAAEPEYVTFETLTDRTTATSQAERGVTMLSEKEQGDMIEYLSSHPELARKKSIELLAQIDRFNAKRREVLAVSVLESIPFRGKESFLDFCRKRFMAIKDPQSPYLKADFEDVLKESLVAASDNSYNENILPLVPFAELEDIARRIILPGVEDPQAELVSPHEYKSHYRK